MELSPVVSGLTGVAIRDLDDSRLEAAVKLWERTAPNDALTFSLAEVLAAVVARMPALVALADDRVIGAIVARVDGERAWILRWSVDADARRHGIGASLLRALERRLLALGVREISMLAPRESLGADTARSIGYVLYEDTVYLEKRQALYFQDVNLVELDLLLGGRRLPLDEPLPPADYYYLLFRGDQRHSYSNPAGVIAVGYSVVLLVPVS